MDSSLNQSSAVTKTDKQLKPSESQITIPIQTLLDEFFRDEQFRELIPAPLARALEQHPTHGVKFHIEWNTYGKKPVAFIWSPKNWIKYCEAGKNMDLYWRRTRAEGYEHLFTHEWLNDKVFKQAPATKQQKLNSKIANVSKKNPEAAAMLRAILKGI